MITVPILMASGASSGGDEVAVVVPETISASDLEADVDIGALFDAGADLDDVPALPVEERGAAVAAEAVAAAPQSLLGSARQEPRAGFEIAETPATLSDPTALSETTPLSETTTSTTIWDAEATAATEPSTAAAPPAPPTTRVPTTEAPTTEAPATEAPTTEAPTTEAPTTEVPAAEAPPVEASTDTAGPTSEQWAALRECESSGDYSVVSSNGRYHGAYQFYQSTWNGLARYLGRSDLVGLVPSQAAPADQDALALLLWQQRGSQPWPHCGSHLPAGS